MIRSGTIALLVVLLSLTVNPVHVSAGLFSVDASADAFIDREDTNSNFGGDPTLSAIYFQNTDDRKTYIRFDLSSVTEPTTTGVTLSLVALAPNTPASLEFNVYGLNDLDVGENWIEGTGTLAAPGFGGGVITWNNAPANVKFDVDGVPGNGVNPSRTTSLGTFSLSGFATQTVTFTSQALINFLQADTNDLVTLIITRKTLSSNLTGAFASRENVSFGPPSLSVTAVPEPASMGLVVMGMVGMIGYCWLRPRQRVSRTAS